MVKINNLSPESRKKIEDELQWRFQLSPEEAGVVVTEVLTFLEQIDNGVRAGWEEKSKIVETVLAKMERFNN